MDGDGEGRSEWEEESPVGSVSVNRFVSEEGRVEPRVPAVSCVATSVRVVVFGTETGDVWLADIAGHLLETWWGRHRGPVAAVAVHDEAIVSAGQKDGSIMMALIGNDGGKTNVLSWHDDHAVITALAIDPLANPAGQRIAFGERFGRVAMVTRGWFGTRSVQVIRLAEDQVWDLQWQGHLLAWVEGEDVRVFDVRSQASVCVVKAPMDIPFMSERPSLVNLTTDSQQLRWVVCWGSTSRFITLSKRLQGESSTATTEQGWIVDIVNCARQEEESGDPLVGRSESLETERILAAVPFDLVIDPDPHVKSILMLVESKGSMRLEILRFENGTSESDEISGKEQIPLAVDPNQVMEAHVLILPGGEPMFLSWFRARSLNQPELPVLLIRKTSIVESIQKHLRDRNFDLAFDAAKKARAGPLRRAHLDLGTLAKNYLDALWASGRLELLASVLPDTIDTLAASSQSSRERTAAEQWDHWVAQFVQAGCPGGIADYIPTVDPRLPKAVYDSVLTALAVSNPEALLSVLQKWTSDVYTIPGVTEAVEGALRSSSHESLKESLLLLYAESGRHDVTLNLFLEEQSLRVFEYIESHALFEELHDEHSLRLLFEIDSGRAAKLLARAPASLLRFDSIASLLETAGRRDWLFAFLREAYDEDDSRVVEYHETLIGLLCEFGAPGELMNLLSTSSGYSSEIAIGILEDAMSRNLGGFQRERVFLLTRIGDAKAAMGVIVSELGDVDLAIEFAESQGDALLWNSLVDQARSDAKFLSALLEHSSGRIDPISLLHLITPDMNIPNLRDQLHRFFIDTSLERRLREGCAMVVLDQVEARVEEYRELLGRPLEWDDPCGGCGVGDDSVAEHHLESVSNG
uniref:Vps41 beta-propeller domain-containing protein n=1 Tax=Compsopogon caeruleus TaxID=31354 RepID=A0A7S1TGB5_9RHOD|mmetsp:Transcript_4961/g.9998  ORF Transcript_4961/g.9998 Transcript_4961/m.9998 type:complete len:865 (+) Transcript_4961:45-2639(+)